MLRQEPVQFVTTGEVVNRVEGSPAALRSPRLWVSPFLRSSTSTTVFSTSRSEPSTRCVVCLAGQVTRRGSLKSAGKRLNRDVAGARVPMRQRECLTGSKPTDHGA